MKTSAQKIRLDYLLPPLFIFLVWLRLPSSTAGDVAQWTEVAFQMGEERGLYSGVYDNKDVGFFLIMRAFYLLFGQFAAPVLWSISWLAIFLVLSKFLSRKRGVRSSTIIILPAAATLAMLFTPMGSNFALTSVIPSAIVLLCFQLIQTRRSLLFSVLLLTLVPFIKLTFTPIVFVLLTFALIIVAKERRDLLSRLTLLLVAITVSVLFFSQTSIFSGWVSAIKENISYAQTSPETLGPNENHFEILLASLSSSKSILMASLIWPFSIGLALWKSQREQILIILSINISQFIVLVLTYLWPHHLSLLLPATAINFAIYICRTYEHQNISTNLPLVLARLLFLAITLISLVNVIPSGFVYRPNASPSLAKEFLKVKPLPDSWLKELQSVQTYSYLSRSDIAPFPSSYLPKGLELECPDTAIFSYLPERAMQQIECSRNSQIVFMVESGIQMPADHGGEVSMNLKNAVASALFTLERDFRLVDGNWYDWRMYIRKVNS